MKVLWLIAACVLILFSCFSGGGSEPEESTKIFGWRTAGLTPNRDSISQWSTGLLKVTHVGNRLFVMDAKVADLSNSYVKDYRIFTALQGDTTWEKLQIPDDISPYSLYVDGQFLYIGTDTQSKLMQYNPVNETWKQFDLPLDSVYRVTAISKYNNQLVVFLSSGYVREWRMLILELDSSWSQFSTSIDSATRLGVHTAIEHNNQLYVATYDRGVWKWNPTDSSWIQLPPPVDVVYKTESWFPRSMTVYKGELYVGYWNGGGIHKLTEQETWMQVDSALADSNGAKYAIAPFATFAMVSTETKFIAAGGGSHAIPVLYMGDTEPKGWRKISRDSWCPPGKFSCLEPETVYSLDVVGDTLYATGWSKLLKFPLSDLDSGIANAPSYYEFPRP